MRCGSMFCWAGSGWRTRWAAGGVRAAGGSTGGAVWALGRLARLSRHLSFASLFASAARMPQLGPPKSTPVHTCSVLRSVGCWLRLHCPGTPRPLIVARRTIQFDVQLVGAVTGCLQPCLLRVGPLAAQPLPSVCLFTSTRSSAAATRLDFHNNRHLHHHPHLPHLPHPHPHPHPPPTTLPHGPLIFVPARSLNMPPPS